MDAFAVTVECTGIGFMSTLNTSGVCINELDFNAHAERICTKAGNELVLCNDWLLVFSNTTVCWPFMRAIFIPPHPPASTKLKGVYTGIASSVCGQNRVRSVPSTILIGSISYLLILSSNLRRCVACSTHYQILKIWNFNDFFKFVTLTLSSFDLGSNMTQWYG